MTIQEGPAKALVTPALITWARLRRTMSPNQAANKLKVKLETLEAWESGHKRPTMRQAKVMANVFSIPFGYLYLSSPPEEKPQIPDLRTVSGHDVGRYSPEFVDTLNDVLRKQAWYRQESLSQGAKPISFIHRFNPGTAPKVVAQDMAATVHLTEEVRRRALSWDKFLSKLTELVEGIGVLVMRTGVVHNNTHRTLDVQEFRGFAISDDVAPVIFINGRDAKAAQIFTLAHELAHLWFGQSGISSPGYLERSLGRLNPAEEESDAVAAELLVPETMFQRLWEGSDELDERAERLAAYFKVSTVVVLRRALTLGLIDRQDFFDLYDRNAGRRPPKRSGGDYYANVVASSSSTVARAILTAVSEGRTSFHEAARLLNVSVDKLDGVSKKLFGEPVF